MVIKRTLLSKLEGLIGKNKVLILTGARRTGKTFLLEQLEERYQGDMIKLNGDLPETTQLLSSHNIATYSRLLGKVRLLMIDEAQMVPGIGLALKIIIDHFKELTIIATGSSSFALTNKTGEPLTGRQLHFHLYPVAQLELNEVEDLHHTMQNLEERLIFGTYPEVLSLISIDEKKTYLQEIVTSYLLKDILIHENVRNSQKMLQLLQLLAFQVGQEVSNDELAKQLGLSKDTVAKYLDLLSKVFVIYRIGGYSSNLRKEVVKSSKWYFVDNGIRNALINNFSILTGRSDTGSLWENYLMSERIKRNSYHQSHVNSYFWRTYDRQEIDLIESADGKISAFEFKWKKDKVRPPIFFSKNYPNAPFNIITKDNYLEFIS